MKKSKCLNEEYKKQYASYCTISEKTTSSMVLTDGACSLVVRAMSTRPRNTIGSCP